MLHVLVIIYSHDNTNIEKNTSLCTCLSYLQSEMFAGSTELFIVFSSRQFKDRQYNGEMNYDRKTNNYRHNITKKTKD